MKKFCLFLLLLTLTAGLIGCVQHKENPVETSLPVPQTSTEATVSGETVPAPETETSAVFRLPQGTVLYHTDLSGMTEKEAWAAISEAARSYKLTVDACGDQIQLTAGQIGLSASRQVFTAYFDDLAAGKKGDEKNLVSFDTAQAVEKLCSDLTRYASDADIRYDRSAGEYVLVPEQQGRSLDRDRVQKLVDRAVTERAALLDISDACQSWAPELTRNSEVLTAAMMEANRYLNLSLTYLIAPDSTSGTRRTISRNELASMIRIDDGFGVSVSRQAVEEFAGDLAQEYSLPSRSGNFKTTMGASVSLKVDYYGRGMDREKLSEDLYQCILSGTSGVREAPYQQADALTNMAFGGTYVEIDLDEQMLWVYRAGECVASSPIVSGCVAEGKMTPEGVYSVQDLDTDCWLTGPTWNDYVNYWIGFYRGYGIHDASWRTEFGGDEYVFNGSHGCANLPVEKAGSVFENVHMGMKVILHGGLQVAEPLAQEVNGTESYAVADDADPFRLDTWLKYEGAEISFASDNPQVVTVDREGLVTVHGVGKANILVRAAEFTHHTAGEMTVAVEVHSACEEGRHAFGPWEVTQAATCVPGTETRTCSKCGEQESREIPAADPHTPGEWTVTLEPGCETPGKRVSTCTVCGAQIEEEIPATGHSFAPDQEFCLNGCGTRNPDYQPPTTEALVPDRPGKEKACRDREEIQ